MRALHRYREMYREIVRAENKTCTSCNVRVRWGRLASEQESVGNRCTIKTTVFNFCTYAVVEEQEKAVAKLLKAEERPAHLPYSGSRNSTCVHACRRA